MTEKPIGDFNSAVPTGEYGIEAETNKTVRIGIVLPGETHEWLKNFKKLKGVPISESVRRAVEIYRLKEEIKGK